MCYMQATLVCCGVLCCAASLQVTTLSELQQLGMHNLDQEVSGLSQTSCMCLHCSTPELIVCACRCVDCGGVQW